MTPQRQGNVARLACIDALVFNHCNGRCPFHCTAKDTGKGPDGARGILGDIERTSTHWTVVWTADACRRRVGDESIIAEIISSIATLRTAAVFGSVVRVFQWIARSTRIERSSAASGTSHRHRGLANAAFVGGGRTCDRIPSRAEIVSRTLDRRARRGAVKVTSHWATGRFASLALHVVGTSRGERGKIRAHALVRRFFRSVTSLACVDAVFVAVEATWTR